MKPSEAIQQVLMTNDVSKYKLSQLLHCQPIMIDQWRSGMTATMRKDAADILEKEFGVKVDPLYQNLRQQTTDDL